MKKIFENWKRFIKEDNSLPTRDIDEVSANTMSAASVFADDGEINELQGSQDYVYEVHTQQEPNPAVVERFAQSLYAGKRSGFLSYYNLDELTKMDLYLIEGQNAGFAIKDGNDIVSVHNNSSLKGLGKVFIDKAISVGGSKLDHFDGFLSGLYRKFGFTDIYEVYQWDEQYKPKGWKYDPIDVMDSKTSIYADGSTSVEGITYDMKDLKETNEVVDITAEDNFQLEINPNEKVNQYWYGRPDVIMRKL